MSSIKKVMTIMRLVSLTTSDGVKLNGFYVPPRSASSQTIVHVHGKCGNFYQNDFLLSFAEVFEKSGVGFLCVNNRGHDVLAEVMIEETLHYIGAAVERFEDCLLDLEAMLSFALQDCADVVLQGHSFGCEKALYYASCRDRAIPVVLLSPSDSKVVQEMYRHGEPLTDQMRRIRSHVRSGPEWRDLAPADSYGVHMGDLDYQIPISYDSLLDTLSSPALSVLDTSKPAPREKVTRGCAYLGDRDPYIGHSVDQMADFLGSRFTSFELLRYDSDHHMDSCEEDVARRIVDWLAMGKEGPTV